MNILQVSLLLTILLKCITASESGVKKDVLEALSEDEREKGFESINDNWKTWRHRSDLFDEVVMRDVEFILDFIKQVGGDAEKRTIAALFIKRPDEVDQVLEKIEYNEYDLKYLTTWRPELAESHENFFKVIDRIKNPSQQEWAVRWGVINLFEAKKHDSVIPLMNALEKRQFNGRKWNNAAIQRAFYEGAERGIKYIVEEFHEHSAITSDIYAVRLVESRLNSAIFQFLLDQADKGDLEKVKNHFIYQNREEFREAIDKAISKAEPVGGRHARRAERRERAERAMETFKEIPGIDPLGKEEALGGIILGYL